MQLQKCNKFKRKGCGLHLLIELYYCNIKEKFVGQNIYRCIHLGMMQSAMREVKSDEHIIVLCSGVPMIPFFPLALNHWKIYTRVSLIMHKASVENAGQSLSQNGFPIEMNYSPIHRDEKIYPVRFSSLRAIGADAMKRRKIWERKKNGCTSLAKVYFLYFVATSSVGVCFQCCQI